MERPWAWSIGVEDLRADGSRLREEIFGWQGVGYKVVAKALNLRLEACVD